MNVRIQRERDAQFERERALVEMRQAIVSAVAPSYVHRLGSSAVFEAVDEALAQIVAAGDHVADPEQVKALWITCARRRLIDQQRSAETRHRDASAAGDTVHALVDNLCGDLSELTEEGRQRWRIREILSVLRGDQRRWAEAWFDEVLSGSRNPGAQPRGLPEALGWTPSKTKSVSRRARLKMAAFIDDRVSGTVCDEQRASLDAFILTGSRQGGEELDGERYASVLFHVAGCDDCWAAWHTRRRTLLGRCRTSLLVPLDAVAVAAHELGDKLAGVVTGAQGQAASLLTRLGVGGAAAAGGGAATIGGKATAACVGIVCAATAGGELAGVLSPITRAPADDRRATVAPAKKAAAPAAKAARQAAAVKVTPPTQAAAPVTQAKTAARRAIVAAETPVVRGTPGDLPPADPATTTSPPPPPPPPPPPAAAAAAGSTFSASGSAEPVAPAPTAAAASASPNRSTCVPGDLGC